MTYPRIVHRDEPVMAAMLEAHANGLSVFTDNKGRSVIADKLPAPKYYRLKTLRERPTPKDVA